MVDLGSFRPDQGSTVTHYSGNHFYLSNRHIPIPQWVLTGSRSFNDRETNPVKCIKMSLLKLVTDTLDCVWSRSFRLCPVFTATTADAGEDILLPFSDARIHQDLTDPS